MAIQDKFNRANVIYKITKDIDLEGRTLTIPEGCTLDFQGGSFANGTLAGDKTEIISGSSKIFNNIKFTGFDDTIFNVDWFVGSYMTSVTDPIVDSTAELQSAFSSGAMRFEFTGNKYFYISATLSLSSQIQILGVKNRGILSSVDSLASPCIFSDSNITMLDILVDNEGVTGFRQVISIGGFILLNRYKVSSYSSIVDTPLVRLRTSNSRFGAAWGVDLDFDIYGTNFNLSDVPNENGSLVSTSLRNFTGLSLEAYNNNYLTYVNVRGRYYNLKRSINVTTDSTSSFVTSLNLYHDSFCDRGGDLNASPIVIYGDHQCFKSLTNNGIGYFNTNSNNVAIIGKIWDTNAQDSTTKLYAPQYGVIDTNVQCQIANISNSGVKTDSPLPPTLNYANLPVEILNTLPNLLEGMLSDKIGINDNTTTIYNSPVSLNSLVGASTIDFTTPASIDVNTVVRKDNMFSTKYIQDRGIQDNNIVYGQLPYMTTNYPFVRAVIRLNTTGAYIPFTQLMNSVLLVMMPSTRLRVKLTRNNIVTSTSETITILDYDTSIEANNTVQYFGGNVTEVKLRPYTDFLSNAFGNTTIDIVVECATNLRGTSTVMPRIGLISTNANNVITRSGGSIVGRLVQWDSMFYSEASGTRYIRYNQNPLFRRAVALQGNTVSSIFKFRVNKSVTNPIVVSLTTDTGEDIQLKCIWGGCTASGLTTSNIWVDKYEDNTFYYYNVQFRNLLRTDVYANHIDTYELLEFLSAIPNGLTVVAQDRLSSTLYGATANRPASPYTGLNYFDSTLGKPLWWNGTAWVTYPDSSGSTMAALTFTGAVEATYNGSTPVTVNIPTGGGGTTNYEDLSNKPKIGDVELVGTKTLVQLGIQPAGDYATEAYVTEQITAVVGNINLVLDTINGEII
nr:MAG TPA: tailspike protein [Crassvirales sp.]